MVSKKVQEFVATHAARVNEILAKSVCTPDVRLGEMNLICSMLMDAKMYCGFRYLSQSEVPAGQLPGIVIHGTIEDTPPEVRFAEGTVDETRIQFFI